MTSLSEHFGTTSIILLLLQQGMYMFIRTLFTLQLYCAWCHLINYNLHEGAVRENAGCEGAVHENAGCEGADHENAAPAVHA